MTQPTADELLDLDQVVIDPALALRIPASLALRRQVLPFAELDGRVYVACLDEKDATAIEAVQRAVHRPVQPMRADPDSLRQALNRIFSSSGTTAATGRRLGDARVDKDREEEGSVALGDELMQAAIVRQASDIHLDPDEKKLQVRFRVDGVLEKFRELPINVHNGLISRFKVLAGMDIAEKRAPQDGRFSHRSGPTSQAMDIRVATLPTKYGERMTLRLLAMQTESLTLEKLGMLARDLDCFTSAIHKPHGMILLTGPTGSGKTTTLYAAIRRLIRERSLNIITIEDPIEYNIAGVAQVEVDSADKVTFDKALRSSLRHDPDVVMIGEIRDRETADVAIKAALTGHLVFSTLHTNSAPSAVTRLIDMQVERYLVAATLRLAVAQRLVRRLCPRCRSARALTAAEAGTLGRTTAAGETVYDPSGCIYCANRGYVGRLGLFEMLPVDELFSRSIAAGAEEADLIAEMRTRSMPLLSDDVLNKLRDGQTSVREALTAVTVW
jgi:type IV pilus assembly protein PilB